MMNGTGALAGGRQAGLNGHMQFGSRSTLTHGKHMHLALAVRRRILALSGHVHHLLENQLRIGDIRNAHGDGAKPLDLVFCGNGAAVPRMRRRKAAIVDQPEPLALAIFKIKRQAAVDLADIFGRDAQFAEAGLPPFDAFWTADTKTGARNAVGATSLAVDRPVEKVRSVPGVASPSA